MTAVIQAEGLGKRYRRGVVESRGMLRDSLMRVGAVAAERVSEGEAGDVLGAGRRVAGGE